MCLHVSFSPPLFAVACPVDLCGSPPWIDLSFDRHICCFLVLLIFVDHCLVACFANLVLSRTHYRILHRNRFFQCDVADWWPLVELVPAHRVAMEPPCCALKFRGAPHRPLMAQVPKLIYSQ